MFLNLKSVEKPNYREKERERKTDNRDKILEKIFKQ